MHRQAGEPGHAEALRALSFCSGIRAVVPGRARGHDPLHRIFRNKAKSIRAAAAAIVERHRGKVPDTMETLHALPGVGRKTANVVLGNAFHKDEGIVVDTHVIRLSQRLGLTKQTDAEKIEQDLMKLVPREHWTMWSHWLIWHGRRRCFARKPDCRHCEVLRLCPSGKRFIRTGEARAEEAGVPA